MNFSMRFLFETLLRSLRLIGLQACEQALSDKRDSLFLKAAERSDDKETDVNPVPETKPEIKP